MAEHNLCDTQRNDDPKYDNPKCPRCDEPVVVIVPERGAFRVKHECKSPFYYEKPYPGSENPRKKHDNTTEK